VDGVANPVRQEECAKIRIAEPLKKGFGRPVWRNRSGLI